MRKMSLILSLILFINVIPLKAFGADPVQNDVTGNLKAVLEFVIPEKTRTIDQKNVTLRLNTPDGKSSSSIPVAVNYSAKTLILDGNSYDVNVSALNSFGMPITTENKISYFSVEVYNLPKGKYSITFEGDGYATYTTKFANIEKYSQQIILNTQNTKFAIGDVNGDSSVNSDDIKGISSSLGSNNSKFDLNKDGKVDITDIVYANHNIKTNGTENIYDTAAIVSAFTDINKINEQLVGKIESGNIQDLFTHSKNPVKIAAKDSSTPIQIPIVFNNAELEQIVILSTTTSGAIEKGVTDVTYIDENNKEVTEKIPFESPKAEGVSYIELTEGKSTITIDLGKRVVVKKVTITVEKVTGQDGMPKYAVIEEIKFLKDILPENPVTDSAVPKNITATPGNEQITLNWDAVSNVTGYKVKYGTTSGNYNKEVIVNTNFALIKGLDNLSNYFFVVYSINSGWTSRASNEIVAVPLPNSSPKAPDNLILSSDTQNIYARWSKTVNALSYNLYIKKSNESSYTKKTNDITSTNFTITALEADTSYDIYVTAKNLYGESGASLVSTIKTENANITVPKIPTLNRIPNTEIEKVTMTDPNNNIEDLKTFDINKVIDNDFSTHWTARIWWETSEFNFTFKTPKEMDYVVYVPRQDGLYKKSLDRYIINIVKSDGTKIEVAKEVKVQNSPETTGFAILSFPRTSDIKTISIRVIQWDGSPTNISISEVAFYNYYSVNDKIKALFTDETFTDIAAGVNQESIDAIRNEVNNAEGYFVGNDILLDELNMAQSLLTANKSVLGKVFNAIESRNTSVDIKAINNFEPMGIVASANSKIIVYAKIPDGETVSIVPTQFFAEAGAWAGNPISLVNGRNIITVPKIGSMKTESGGSLYLTYTGNRQNEIKLHVKGGTLIPTLELSNWNDLSVQSREQAISNYISELKAYTPKVTGDKTTAIKNSTEISLPNVLLSLPADQVLSGITSVGTDLPFQTAALYNNILAWEDLIKITYKTHGIDDPLTEKSRHNIRYARMFANAFMYASGAHIGVGYGSVAALMQGKPVSVTGVGNENKLFGWGIAHEIGHVMDTLGKPEITNNIYSMFAQTYDGSNNALTSRLESSDIYTEIFDNVAQGSIGSPNNVFLSLGMYWQLHLAYDNANDNFYNKLNKAYRNGVGAGFIGDDKFAVVASSIAGKDLTEFFQRWGIKLSGSAETQMRSYGKEDRKIYYLNDNSRRLMLNGVGSPQNVELSASLITEEKSVQIVININCDENLIQGYEIIRNNKPVAFSKSKNYVDKLGAANNLTLEYTINAIDVFGNVVAVANAGQTKVSFDGTIGKDSWRFADQDASTVIATLSANQPIAGIKISNQVAETGTFEVYISSDGNNFTKVKTVDFSKNDSTRDEVFISYFNKPGTSDTRIWTYDAKLIKIVGLPSTVTMGNLDFISYPGDNVEITQIGYLESDYVYDGSDGVIKAGTLVVMGSYRGDPVYNTISVKGRFAEVNHNTGVTMYEEREINGYSLLLAEIPEDGQVSRISDGIWIFVPDDLREAELTQKDAEPCTNGLLPYNIKAEMYITDDPNNASSKRLASDTLWITSPSDDTMPNLILNGGVQ